MGAGLETTLAGPEMYTVFAPTDAAFAKVPVDTLNSLLGDVPALTTLLLNHVVSGEVLSSSLFDGMQVPTLGGLQLTVSMSGPQVQLLFADGTVATTVVTTDLKASNGI